MKYTLEDQRPHEDVILTGNRHPWVLAKPALLSAVLITAIVLIFVFLGFTLPSLIAAIIILLIFILELIVNWFLFTNTFFIITNERVVSVAQESLFKRHFQETELKNVYNLSYKMEGFWHTLLNYGDLRMTTEGDFTDCITLKNIENPHMIHETLSRLHNAANAAKED